jgi:hypothetical protein
MYYTTAGEQENGFRDVRWDRCIADKLVMAAACDPGATFLSHISLALPDEALWLSITGAVASP